ncbi:hypothetical protein E8E13_005977 [Curvularia kusanoi]|uniref:Peptidase S8/S53 domain-containing protein n=1 Tax=Curvularia kusanoi TaxID=90978 RepID=A0A9P4W923_CURKU|nr:hypothetical protein E8E13_005977 [Curvularia kusanoi]
MHPAWEPGNMTYIFDDSAGEGTCAYVLDTGIFVEHPDFEGRAEHLVNFSGEESKEDDVGHGTHVAGTIGSRTYGVAKKTQLYAVKVLDSSGSGSISAILAGIDFVARDAAQRSSTTCPKGVVANMSFGGRKKNATNQAIAAAVAKGVFFAVAAGNDGIDARYVSPASEPSACAVGATALNESIADWSNYGPFVDVLAPGVAITSLSKDGGTAVESGTSMAAPHVAGLAAIAAMATKGAVKDLKELTPNLLINNGALGD